MLTSDINYLAVAVVALGSIVIGSLWYSKLMFLDYWMKGLGKTKEQMDEEKKCANMPALFGMAIVVSLITAYVLAHFVDYLGADTFGSGMQAAFWIWLGFVATTSVHPMIWEGRSWRLFIVFNSMQLLYLLLAGGVLAVW